MKHWTIAAIIALLSMWIPPHHHRCIDPPCLKGRVCIPAGERCNAHPYVPPPVVKR